MTAIFMFFSCGQRSNPHLRDFRLSNGYKARSLLATGLFSLVLEAGNFDKYLFAYGKRAIQYTERGAFEYMCDYMYIFFGYFPLHRPQFLYADNNINILFKMQFTT